VTKPFFIEANIHEKINDTQFWGSIRIMIFTRQSPMQPIRLCKH